MLPVALRRFALEVLEREQRPIERHPACPPVCYLDTGEVAEQHRANKLAAFGHREPVSKRLDQSLVHLGTNRADLRSFAHLAILWASLKIRTTSAVVTHGLSTCLSIAIVASSIGPRG